MRRPAWGASRRLSAAVGVLAALLLLVTPPPALAANREPFAGSQWGIRQVEADTAWNITRGRGAKVGIIDTGVDFTHAELAGRVVTSTRCLNTGGSAARCGGSAQDDSGHGTHVAGIVGAPLDGAGVAGVAPDASLFVVKALRSDGSGEAGDVAAGIDWLLGHGVQVLNLSLAETLSPRRVQGSPLEAAIRRAADAGVVVVLAAGNHGEAADGTTGFPLPAVVVGATGKTGGLARYSRPLGSGIRWGMVAPGGDAAGGTQAQVVSTYWFAGRRNAYAWSEGTSMAAPHVAGAAALLAAQGVRGEAAVNRLLATANPAACGPGCRGLLNVRAAVGAAAPSSGVAGAANAAPPAAVPPEPPPATSVVPATTPPVAAVAPPPVEPAAEADPPVDEEAAGPVGLSAPLESPTPRERSDLAAKLAVIAGVALLAVSALTAVVAGGSAFRRRQLRADEEW